MDDALSDFFEEHGLCNANNNLSGDDLFSILESLDDEGVVEFPPPVNENAAFCSKDINEETTTTTTRRLVSQKSTSSSTFQDYSETEVETTSPKSNKRMKLSAAGTTTSSEEANPDGQQRMSHITVERNRRKQMNEHLSVLRSLMPCFYVKRVSFVTCL